MPAGSPRLTCSWSPRSPSGSYMDFSFSAPQYLIRDRDRVYGEVFTRQLRAIGIRDRPTAPRSPWQNGYVERLIGSIRRDCLDHVIVFGDQHLRHVLSSYAQYHNGARTHLSLAKDSPPTRSVQTVGSILPLPILGGLHLYLSQILSAWREGPNRGIKCGCSS